MSIEFEDLHIDLSIDKVISEYPLDKIPTRLKRRTGKSKKTGFETIDVNLYDPAAKMVAFHTHADRIIPWIKALEVLYYDNIGKMESMNVRWVDEPDKWTDVNNNSNSIVIELSSTDKDLLNPLFYKLTFFISTGTIQVQGNEKDLFTNGHFSLLKRIVAMVIEKIPQSIRIVRAMSNEAIELDSEVSDTEIINESPSKDFGADDITHVKTIYSSAKEGKEQESVYNPITCQDTSNNLSSNSCATKQSKMTYQTIPSKGEELAIKDSVVLSLLSENNSSTKELGEKFDLCITRMEGSFVKAIQELSKTQNDIFSRAMTSIRDEISSSVIKDLRPVIQNELKSLKDNIHSEIMSIKDSQVKQIHTENKLLQNKIDTLKCAHYKELEQMRESCHQKLDIKADQVQNLQSQIDEVKSAHHTEITKMRETYHQKLELQGEKHRNKHDSLQSEHKHEISLIQEQNESEMNLLKKKLEEREAEIVSLKLHDSRCSDLDVGSSGVHVVGARRNTNDKIDLTGPNSSLDIGSLVSAGDSSSSNKNNKPYVLLIGTSNISKIREDKLTPEISVVKHIAYTIPETLETVRNFQCVEPPKEVVFHSFTNDIKSNRPDKCIELFNEVIEQTLSRWKDTKIVISLETTRADNTRYNTSVKVLNALLEDKFLETSNIYLCDNSNFFTHGEPDKSLLHSDDLYHLSDKGASRLAINIKTIIHSSLGLDASKPSNNRARKPGVRGFDSYNSANFPFPFIPPGYFINRRGNGRGGRGRRYYQK